MGRTISLIDPPAKEVRWALLAKGFRPFFLGAGLFAALYMPVWAWMFTADLGQGYMPKVAWHAHEMLHGFAIAVIAGFLLTAVSNWTKLNTAEGGALGALVALWLLGRGAMLSSLWVGEGAYWAVALMDLAFVPGLVLAISLPIFKSKNTRNYGFPVMLTVLWVSNLLTHLGALKVIPDLGMTPIYVTLNMVLVIIILVTGRIVPLFTRNKLDDNSIRSNPKVDKSAIVLAVVFAVASAFGFEAAWAVAGLLSLTLLIRSWHWGGWRSRKDPLLWILHMGNTWLILGFGLIALSGFGLVAGSVATHALTTGVVGVLCLGMMSRVARGHTGRGLETDRLTDLSFWLMGAAVLVRVLGPVISGSLYVSSIIVSSILWSLAFLLFLKQHTKILVSPRADGRPG